MPLSLKFLIDDALGEEDFQALVRILSVLAVAGIFTSIVAVWYEKWDASLAASLISDVRARLFDHVQDLPSAYFARTRRGEILSRFSVDLSAFEGAIKSFANSCGAAVPGIDRRHRPDAVPELAARRGGAAGVSDHADRAADPDAEGGAGQLRAEAQRIRAARHGAGKRRGAGGDQGVQPAAPDLRLVHDAQRRRAPQDRLRDVPVDHGRAHRDDFGVVAPPRGAGARRLSRHQGSDHHRNLRDVRERVLGGLLQHRPHHAFHPGVDPVGGGGPPHSGTAGRADPRRRPPGRARSAAHHQRHHLRPRHLPVRRQPVAGARQFQPRSSRSASASPSSARAAPARARCST